MEGEGWCEDMVSIEDKGSNMGKGNESNGRLGRNEKK